jgi:hypothetical protein
LIVAEDRVAIDHIAWGILDKKRVTDAAPSTAVRDLGKTTDPAEIDAKPPQSRAPNASKPNP